MKMPDTKGGGYAAWWLIGTEDDNTPDGTKTKQNGEIEYAKDFLSGGLYGPITLFTE